MQVIFEDEWMLVLEKPAGLVVAPSETQQQETLADIVKRDFGVDLERAGIVHRLDKDTSGIILVAKTEEALLNLQVQFKNREVSKAYTCLVHGFLEGEREIVGAIGRNPGDREKFVVMEGGKEAVTRIKSLELRIMNEGTMMRVFEGFNKLQFRKLERSKYGEFSKLLCLPFTGRTHQIRVHLKYIGFPIVGDEKYGGRKTARLDRRWCRRQFLHASKIEFKHPISGKEMRFESELPEDLEQVLGVLDVVNK